MKIVIESTEKLTTIDGCPVRAWNGTTEQGVACVVFVRVIAVKETDDTSRFEAELKEQLSPGRYIPLSMIL